MATAAPEALSARAAGEVVRAVMLLACAVLALVTDSWREAELGVAALVVVLLLLAPRALPQDSRALYLVGPLEAAVWATTVVLSGSGESAALPYLVAPAFGAGLVLGVQSAALVPTTAGLWVLLVTSQVDAVDAGQILPPTSEWIALALAFGLLAAWIRQLRSSDRVVDDYASAYYLLEQLRVVARRLSVGLDAPALAERLLTDAQSAAGPSRGAVLVRSQQDRLVPLATSGIERLTWPTDLHSDGPLQEVWLSQRPYVGNLPLTARTEGSSLVLPLMVAKRTIGLLALDLMTTTRVGPDVVTELERLCSTVALRIETALLFDEVREVATVEERRRLARELHDGVAQELAAFGYGLDALAAAARTQAPGMIDELRQMRADLTRTIADLRSSMFDLRNEVDQHGGLGAALGEYVRRVGSQTELTVHLTLDEGDGRLPPDQEAELFRIAQEAIANVRKHAGAQNLWVVCTISPPAAQLLVEDDGDGALDSNTGGHGLSIMAERAQRLGATFEVTPRVPRGTSVRCVLGRSSVRERKQRSGTR